MSKFDKKLDIINQRALDRAVNNLNSDDQEKIRENPEVLALCLYEIFQKHLISPDLWVAEAYDEDGDKVSSFESAIVSVMDHDDDPVFFDVEGYDAKDRIDESIQQNTGFSSQWIPATPADIFVLRLEKSGALPDMGFKKYLLKQISEVLESMNAFNRKTNQEEMKSSWEKMAHDRRRILGIDGNESATTDRHRLNTDQWIKGGGGKELEKDESWHDDIEYFETVKLVTKRQQPKKDDEGLEHAVASYEVLKNSEKHQENFEVAVPRKQQGERGEEGGGGVVLDGVSEKNEFIQVRPVEKTEGSDGVEFNHEKGLVWGSKYGKKDWLSEDITEKVIVPLEFLDEDVWAMIKKDEVELVIENSRKEVNAQSMEKEEFSDKGEEEINLGAFEFNEFNLDDFINQMDGVLENHCEIKKEDKKIQLEIIEKDNNNKMILPEVFEENVAGVVRAAEENAQQKKEGLTEEVVGEIEDRIEVKEVFVNIQAQPKNKELEGVGSKTELKTESKASVGVKKELPEINIEIDESYEFSAPREELEILGASIDLNGFNEKQEENASTVGLFIDASFEKKQGSDDSLESLFEITDEDEKTSNEVVETIKEVRSLSENERLEEKDREVWDSFPLFQSFVDSQKSSSSCLEEEDVTAKQTQSKDNRVDVTGIFSAKCQKEKIKTKRAVNVESEGES